ncbi:hypothetical protein CC80DRAFT_93229 [Byssothecium circinans]|uniref:alpha-galactosidase n=1 Tax=Byssothecium circinans TaxID=147558 RepID=A0A6A5TUP9_9PLEO|nr:hypothetical protein CC80DRAFT_93229 [Byssothecium circinans]
MEEGKLSTHYRHAWTLRRKLLVFIPLTFLILSLALGLGLGLTLGRDGNDDDDDEAGSNKTSPLPSPSTPLLWTPPLNSTWQILLQNPILPPTPSSPLVPDVGIYDLDLFDTPASTIAALHALGKKVICYFSAGTYEPGRPDSGQFQEADMGKAVEGWPGERWVRLGSEGVRGIVRARVRLAREKGCDGVDPDNVDGYQNDNGLGLTPQSSISFMSYLSNLTTPLNLTLGLKNAGDIIATVLPIVHFSVNEECVKENECATFHQFIDAGKPVFHIEYPQDAGKKLRDSEVGKYCGGKGMQGFSTVMKKMELDGWVEYCDGRVEVTGVNQTEGAH